FDFPDDDTGLAAAGEQGAVGAKGEALNDVRMSLQSFRLIPGGPVPDFHEAVDPRGGQARARRVEGQTGGAPLVMAQLSPLPGREVPHLHGALLAPGHELLAVGTEERRPDVILAVLDGRQFLLPGGDVPDPDGAVHGTAGEALAVGGKVAGVGV